MFHGSFRVCILFLFERKAILSYAAVVFTLTSTGQSQYMYLLVVMSCYGLGLARFFSKIIANCILITNSAYVMNNTKIFWNFIVL